jgi:hypothetical protein
MPKSHIEVPKLTAYSYCFHMVEHLMVMGVAAEMKVRRPAAA